MIKLRLNQSLMGLIVRQFFEFIPYYLVAFGALYALHSIQSELPFMAKELADIVDKGVGEIDTWSFVLIAVGIIFFRTLSRLSFFYPARVLQKDLRVELVHRLESVSPFRYKHHSSGQIFQVLGADLEHIRALIGFALLQVGNIIIALSILVPKMMKVEGELVLALIPLVLAFVIFTVVVAKNRHHYRAMQDIMGDIQNYIMESYQGKKTIKNFHSEGSFIEVFRQYSLKELWHFYRSGMSISICMPLIPLGVGLSLIWGAMIIKQSGFDKSSLVLFSGFVFLFLEPMMFLSWIGVVFSQSFGAWKRIQNIVSDAETKSDIEKWLEENNNGEQLDQLAVRFWDKPCDIKIAKNKWNVIIGKTGCGKSEVMSQVADYFKTHGEISFVAQSPYLYNDSLENNIFLGQDRDDKRRDEAYQLLTIFGLDSLANTKDDLLSMEVGENGKRLSGGQAKRLCLVRSLMSESKLILWDDPFSSVDVILEKQIITELKNHPILKEKTLLLTSHRITTVRACDYVTYLEMNQGVIEHGETTECLSENNAIYEYFKNQMV